MNDEQRRLHAYERIREATDEATAEYIMSVLPPSEWDKLAFKVDLERFATKEDLERFATKEDLEEVKLDVAVLKDDVAILKDDVAVLKDDVAILKDDVAVLKDDVAVLKQDMAGVRHDISDLRKDMNHMGEVLTVQIGALRDEFKGTLHEAISGTLVTQMKITVIALVGSMTVLASVLTGLHTLA